MSNTEGYRVSYFITSEIKVRDVKLLSATNIVKRNFQNVKEAQKFIDDMVKFTETNNSFFNYNFEEIQSVLLESRGKITRDNQMKTDKITEPSARSET